MHTPLHRPSLFIRLFLTVLSLAPLGCSEGYDLQGPPPKVGQKVMSFTNGELKDGTITFSGAGGSVTGLAHMSSSSAERMEVQAVQEGRPSRLLQRITKDQTTTKLTVPGEAPVEEQSDSALAGTAILWTRSTSSSPSGGGGGGGGWARMLVDGAGTDGGRPLSPTLAQSVELRGLVDPDSGSSAYPSGEVKVGHTWTLEGPALARLLGSGLEFTGGTATMVLEKITEQGGAKLAHIRVLMQFSGRSHEPGGDTIQFDFAGSGTEVRNLDTGLSQEWRLSGAAVYTGTLAQEGGDVQMHLSGALSIRGSESFELDLAFLRRDGKAQEPRPTGRFGFIKSFGDWLAPGFGTTLMILVGLAIVFNGLKSVKWGKRKSKPAAADNAQDATKS